MAEGVQSVFLNSDYVVIQYIDMIKSPYLVLLDIIRTNPNLREVLKIEEIETFDTAALYEWYVNRKHQNFFIDLNRDREKYPDEFMDGLLADQMCLAKEFYTNTNMLCTEFMLKFLKSKNDMVKDVIIYFPFNTPYAKEDLRENIGHSFTFMSDFDEICKKCGSNCTYFLSDIDLINRMEKNKVLEFSSVILPIEYRYNKKNMNDFKIDFDKKLKDVVFKLSFMRACTVEDHDNGSLDRTDVNLNTYQNPVM